MSGERLPPFQAEPTHMHLPVAEAYDLWAPVYDRYDNPMVFMASRILAALIPDASGLDIFEFGCGTGRNLKALQQAGARTVNGCDLSAGMLTQAGIGFRHDIATPLPWPGQSVDLSLFSLTLEHIAAPAPPLVEARRILRPGGRILIIEIHPFLSLSGVAAHFDHGGRQIQMPTFPHQFSGYLHAFADSRLRVENCREWRPVDFDSPPPKALKRGPEFPLTVSFTLVPDAH